MIDNFKDFGSYCLDDFICNEKFFLWVTTPTDELNVYWQQVIKDYPEKLAIINRATTIIHSLKFETDEMTTLESNILWQDIKLRMSSDSILKRIFPLWIKYLVAASLFGIFFSLLISYYNKYEKEVITTGFGQIKTTKLPDGTVITLNANSKLSYTKNWTKDKIREVWVNGEALFKVNHLHKSGKISPKDRFIVHANKVNVEVLGTTFSVKDRMGSVKVALLSGKVSLDIQLQHSKVVVMNPGEVVEYSEKKNIIARNHIDIAEYTSWKDGVLHFKNTSFKDVVSYIEDTYGYNVILKDPQIAMKKLSGSFAASNEEAFFKAISSALGITILKNKDTHQLIIQN